MFGFLLSSSNWLSASNPSPSPSSAALQGRLIRRQLCALSFSRQPNFFPAQYFLVSLPEYWVSPFCYTRSPSTLLPSWPQELLMVKLGCGGESSGAPAPSANFDLGSKNRVDAVGFNPILQFDRIGRRKLDQVCSISVWLNLGKLCLQPRWDVFQSGAITQDCLESIAAKVFSPC